MKKNKENLSISLVIPTYNNEGTIVTQLLKCEEILKRYTNNFQIIIADDLSKDNTRSLLTKYFKNRKDFKIIFNRSNLGISKNVKQLYLAAQKDYIFFYSADGDWDTNDIDHLIKKQITSNADIVIGKRTKKIGYTYYRNLVSFFHRFIPLVLFRVDTIDPGGIKIIKRELTRVPLVSDSQFFEAEIIIRAIKRGYKITSYPIIYRKLEHGSGVGGKYSAVINAFKDVIRLRLFL